LAVAKPDIECEEQKLQSPGQIGGVSDFIVSVTGHDAPGRRAEVRRGEVARVVFGNHGARMLGGNVA